MTFFHQPSTVQTIKVENRMGLVIHVPGGFHLGEGLERAGLAAGLGRDTADLDTTGVLEPTGLTLDLVTETNQKTIKCVIHI